ncbi:protoporphyrinogen/coproporphyrinogen oxidase [Sphingomonas sp. Leaf339]|uniref:protoporphyrinogen/coproporphyrinogen oxidase n=1 Tax=Sphingomonas sp. Leaf339 TaxID=1736343 RepID=UPI00138F3C33|nr:FAD-dependent oxidoreductase [Sphingomonas sp. Leaf339]
MPDMPDYVDVAIISGGPCGLGAAWRLEQSATVSGAPSYLLVEKGELGGSSRSVTTPEGFVFDFGGHILYPHANYATFGELVDTLVDGWDRSVPVRGVFYDGKLIPYPVQQNIHHLGKRKLASAFAGLAAARVSNGFRRGGRHEDRGLADHLRQRFGRGLARHVMEPINQKMWSIAPAAMSSQWTHQRSGSKVANVADVSLRKVVRSIFTGQDHVGWDDTTTIPYPRGGGTGAIWRTLSDQLPATRVRTGAEVVRIDTEGRRLWFADGGTLSYGSLISSMPLDLLMTVCGLETTPDLPPFHYASASFVGFGIEGAPPAWLTGVHSFHLPDPDIPCWRLSFPASLSDRNVPDADHWSILCEISHNDGLNYDVGQAAGRIEGHLRQIGIIPVGAKIVSLWQHSMEHGYPVPFFRRDHLLGAVHGLLEKRRIFSRGRFGGWKYEVSNMDHPFMQGVEAVDRVLHGTAETTYVTPEMVN